MKKTILIILLLIPMARAFGPSTHIYILDKLFEEYPNDPVVQTCMPYIRYFRAGILIPDITVVYYYSEGGKPYQATHDWRFYEKILSQIPSGNTAEKCFAYGIAGHLIEDGVSHNQFVAETISRYNIPNSIVHPILESKLELAVLKMHPEYISVTASSMDLILNPNDPEYCPKCINYVQNALSADAPLDAKQETIRLNTLIGGGNFYETGYTPVSDRESLMFQLWKIIRGLGSIIPVGNEEAWIQRAADKSDDIYTHFISSYYLNDDVVSEPHGFTKLRRAEESIMFLKIFGVAFILFAIFKKGLLKQIKRRIKI